MSATEQQVDAFPGIGGSEIAAVMGISPFATPLDIWRAKVLKQNDTDETGAMRAGKRFEPHILAAYQKTLPEGSRMWTPERTVDGYRRCSPDALAEVQGWGRVVEAKSTIMGREWGDDGSDEVPLHYVVQGTWYMDLLGLEEADYPVIVWPHQTGMRDVLGLTPAEIVAEVGIQVMRVRYSPSLAKRMREAADRFWNENVLAETPPPPVNLEDAKRFVWSVKGKTVPVTEDMVRTLMERDRIKASIKAMEEREEALSFALRTSIGDAEAVLDSAGKPILTLKTVERASYVAKASTFRQLNTTKTWKDSQKELAQ